MHAAGEVSMASDRPLKLSENQEKTAVFGIFLGLTNR
jgi:hypothetical protein